MSSAQENFSGKYQIVREVGKGGFATVFQCKDKQTHQDFAVKVVDLRPLRMRERFDPARLRREVDIMKRLHHPNIIEFVEVYEDADHLMTVMEYCPGKELFDAILERKYFQENDARPIFAQIARALYYLHTLNILHRDIKPENVLLSSGPSGFTAKLLDFGLSKNAGNGSAAKTFVGTPCYVAPEVEYTSKGLGGTYSFPADCWSLGAVLYVMLVARFPEFEQDATGKVVLRLPPALWGNVSVEAKDLIRSLMNTNPNARLTASSVLMHPWLGSYRATQEELSRVAVSNYDLNRRLQEEEAELEASALEFRGKFHMGAAPVAGAGTAAHARPQAPLSVPARNGTGTGTAPGTGGVASWAAASSATGTGSAMWEIDEQPHTPIGPLPAPPVSAAALLSPGANRTPNTNTLAAATQLQLGHPPLPSNPPPPQYQQYEQQPRSVEMTPGGVVVHHQAMVVRRGYPGAAGGGGGGSGEGMGGAGGVPGMLTVNNNEGQLPLAPLLHLQRSIATCFAEVHDSYRDLPEVASEVRHGASLCRDQLTESMKMLRKVEQTAEAVLGMFPDLVLAVEEGEPQLAADFFSMVKGWVAELRELVSSTQSINKASMFQV
jgi:serine/threonine protein kinase